MTRKFLITVMSLIAAMLLSACTEAPEEQVRRGSPSFHVVVEPVILSTERTRVEAVGTSRALRSVTLHPATSGEVVAVNFEPGQYVEKADVLVQLDQRQELLAVELATARLDEAERLYKRYKKSAEATVETTLDAARTGLEAARIELNQARIDLEDRSVRAPFRGYVGITDVDAGDRVQPTTPIVTLDDRSSLLVSFAVPEMMVGKVSVGDPVNISTWNLNGLQAEGQVVDIDSRINPETRVFVTRARVENSDDRLRPGMSFRVTLDVDGEPWPVLSEVALQWGAEGSYVWSVVDGKARRIPVSIVQRQKGKVLVKADLAPGDLVVVEGIQRLRPGVNLPPEMVALRDDASRAENFDDESSGTNPG